MWIIERARAWRGHAILGALWLLERGAKPLGLHRLYLDLLMHLVRGTRLFDAVYYQELNTDLASTELAPLRHYVAWGDREGRAPMPLFEPNYYRLKAVGRTKQVNALLHYHHIGRHLGLSPSAWFDVDYYRSINKDVRRSGIDPIIHYLRWGWREGRSPSPLFDGNHYLQEHPEVAAAQLNPLIHYIRIGRLRNFNARPASHSQQGEGGQGKGRDSAEPRWEDLKRSGEQSPPVVDVIVPVYGGRSLTLRCLYSVLSAGCKTPFELIVIDDATPDRDLAETLNRLAGEGYFTLLRNSDNLGFVATVNRGMRLHQERDVVLLNSDTEVYNDWLDRLRDAATREPDIASATPLSNNATICSYPRFLHDSPFPLEVEYAELDRLTSSVNSDVAVDAPTGVGFCMYMKREAITRVGQFDEVTFGRGYGEENDWCQRGMGSGWRNIIAADVFVRHIGGASFQGETNARIRQAMRVMRRRHPGYQEQVDRFIATDPLRDARWRLDWARLRRQARSENVLLVCHNRGGGAERHLQEDTTAMLAQGKGVYYLRPARRSRKHVRLEHHTCRQLYSLPRVNLADYRTLARMLREIGITEIHSHGLIDFSEQAPTQLLAVARELDVPLHVDVHDYKIICPRINLTDTEGVYCGEPDEEGCDACLAQHGNEFGCASIRAWRESHHAVLRRADSITVPDGDVARRLRRYYPDLAITVRPHEALFSVLPSALPACEAEEKLRVVVIGAISKIKGYRVLLDCARLAKKKCLPIEFAVMGFSHNDRLLEQAGVRVTGRYLEQDALGLLQSLRPHAVWLPSIWPETYSYTLSLAMKGGYPVYAFDLGAIARRLSEVGWPGGCMPLSSIGKPWEINQIFMKYRRQLLGQPKGGK